MNTGTKIRTAIRIATSINTAAFAAMAAIGELNIGWLTTVWTIITIVSDVVVAVLTTYYNQDYTEAAAVGTGYTRILKAQENGVVFGENFFDFVEETEGGEDDA